MNLPVKVSQEQIKSWQLPIPPIEEEDKIVEHLQNQLQQLNVIQTYTNNILRNLEEFKQTLIAHVVTGKIKV